MNMNGQNRIGACFLAVFAVLWSCLVTLGEEVVLRFTYDNGNEVCRKVDLENISDSTRRLTVSKDELGTNIKWVDVLPVFAAAKKGDNGYWIHGRGTYGNFDKDEGSYLMAQQAIPIWGMKTDAVTFWANMRTYRFDYKFNVHVRNGVYEVFARIGLDHQRRWFNPPYDDLVIDFNLLIGSEANYSGMGRAYRKFQLDRGAVKTIKDRIDGNPQLDYLCDSIVVRIQVHAAKPPPRTPTDFNSKNEPSVVVHMPFAIAEEFLQQIRDAGVDKVTVCSAGWQCGGYDGRAPLHFPVCAEAGGESGLRRLIERAREIGYQFTLHAAHTDSYMVSPMWTEGFVAKRADGSLNGAGCWRGGKSYAVCQRAAWEGGWIHEDMQKMRELGVGGPHYIDVYSANNPVRCADPHHPATPEQIAEYQNRILAQAKALFGGAASEGGFDHVAGNLDYINYVGREIKEYEEHPEKYPLVKGVVPLWEIVYHGIILSCPDRWTQNHTCRRHRGRSAEGEDPKIALKLVEFGGRPIFYTCSFADVPCIKQAWEEFMPVRRLQRELMERHSEIAPKVFATCYADGTEIISNYSEGPFVYRGKTIKPLSWREFR